MAAPREGAEEEEVQVVRKEGVLVVVAIRHESPGCPLWGPRAFIPGVDYSSGDYISGGYPRGGSGK